MFNQFNRAGHRQLSAEISQELVALGKRHGLDISVGGGQIGETSLTIKVVATTNDTQSIEAKAKRELGIYGHYYGLKEDDYGAVFTSNGRRFKLTGVSPSRPKYPIDGEDLGSGKRFKFTESVVRHIIAARANRQPAPKPQPAANSNTQGDNRYAGLAQF